MNDLRPWLGKSSADIFRAVGVEGNDDFVDCQSPINGDVVGRRRRGEGNSGSALVFSTSDV